MKKFLKSFIFVSILVIGIFGIISFFNIGNVFAQQKNNVDLGLSFAKDTGLSTTDIRVTVANIIRIGLGILGIVAVCLILYGGFLWMTSGGDQGKVDSAKKVLLNATIGLAIILSAFGIASFVINKLQEATTSTLNTNSSSNTGGGNIGGSGGGAGSFKVDSITPTGQLTIRNVVIKIYFNKNVDPKTVNSSSIIITDLQQGVDVQGTYSSNGSEVTFIPSTSCPTPNATLKCFPSNTEFKVELNSNTPVKSDQGQQLSCSFGGICVTKFKTGSLVDTQKPNITVFDPTNGASVQFNQKIKLQAQADDDSGIASVAFYVDNSQTNITPNFDSPKNNVLNYTAESFWDTNGLALKSTHKIKATAKDLDSNESTSQEIEVIIRAQHCFNLKQDFDETGTDCGGADCGACLGSQCTSNSQCQSAVCSKGQCVMWPIINGFSPEKSAQETFVTIFGSGFGKYVLPQAGVGSVVNFLQGSSVVQAVIPQQCGSFWTDNQIIVEVPKTLKDGAYDIEVITSNNCDPDGKGKCNDTTQNDRGIKKSFNVDQKETRPSICSANPSVGQFQSTFDIEGKAFGTQAGDIMIGQYKTTYTGSWTSNKITGIVVPNLIPGNLRIGIISQNKESNAVSFEIKESANVPIITNLNPDNGNEGQYVQISGTGFGFTQGKVVFIDPQTKNQIQASQSFPKSCEGGTWTDKQVIIKVPNNLENGKIYDVIVETAVTKSNTLKFTKNNRALTPGLCKIDPIQGPTNIQVNLYGENLGANQGKLNFNTTQVTTANIAVWNNNEIQTRVPAMSHGNTKVQVIHENSSLSNKLDFTVGSCKANNNTCATTGFICCFDGTCQKSCPAIPNKSGFTWKFSTGIIPDSTNGGKNNASLVSPEVLLEQFCTNSKKQSPSPWIDSEDACPNADIKTLFTIPMDSTTFITQKTADNTIKIFECKDRLTCEKTPLEIDKLTTIHGDKNSVIGFQFSLKNQYKINTTLTPLKADTWYEVRLTGGDKGIKGKNGIPLENEYIWKFKTRDALCSILKIDISPSNAVIDTKYTGIVIPPNIDPDGIQDLVGSAIAQNCNNINSGGLSWSWQTAVPSKVAFVKPLLELTSNKAQVKGLEETGKVPVDISATTETQTGVSKISVDFNDPKVIDFWPNCNEACINASIGAEFNTDINDQSLTGNVLLFLCNDATCGSTGLKSVELKNLSIKDKILQTQHTDLLPNEYYRVVLINGIKNNNGTQLTELNYIYDSSSKTNDSYSWIFRTNKSGVPCEVAQINVRPLKSIVYKIGDKKDFLAEPLSNPDSCSSTGQKLDPYSYDWSWSISNNIQGKERAEIYKNTIIKLDNIKLGCTTNCLLKGSSPQLAVCGNGIKEIGEDCDDSNNSSKDGCSEICLNEGNSNTCGNGKIEIGEDCDDSNKTKGDGCSEICLNEGGGNFCGNGSNRRGINEVGEDCDDGNKNDNDGCSSKCLNEGSKSKLEIAVCGDGIIDSAEDCDEGGICDGGVNKGQVCGKNIGCAGDPLQSPPIPPGVCRPNGIVNGCNEKCLRTGNKDIKTCGNTKLENNLGEQCDDGNLLNGDGCSDICLYEGSTYLTNSLCGNGKPELGEVGSCELGLPANSLGGPYSWVTAKEFIKDSNTSTISTAKVVAEILKPKQVSGTADFILNCSYKNDSECGDSKILGRAENSCCYARPKVEATTAIPIYPIDDPKGIIPVCTNTLIQLPFNMPMREGSFGGNVILVEGVQGDCVLGESNKVIVHGLEPSNLTWCISQDLITSSADSSGKVLQVGLTEFLKPNTYYRIIIKGDSNLDDDVVDGIMNVDGVGYNGPNKITFEKKDSSVYTWVFKTANKCLLSKIKIENTDNSNEPFIFRDSINAKNYKAFPLDENGQIVQEIPNYYSWNWLWNVGPKEIFDYKLNQSSQDSISVASIGRNGKGILSAEARIDDTKLKEAIKLCSLDSDCNSGICLAKNNKPCTGKECGTPQKPEGHCRISVAEIKNIESFICDNPWPQGGQQNIISYIDDVYNFKVNYCRDNGISRVCRGAKDNGVTCNTDSNCDSQSKCVLNVDDDLPIAQIPIKREIGGKICVGGINSNNPCNRDIQCGAGGVCKDTDLLSEYIFVLQKEQKTCHDANRNSDGFICKTDNDCKNHTIPVSSQNQIVGIQANGYVYCYSDVGQKLASINDGIGIRVMKNPKHLSAGMWYQESVNLNAQPKETKRIDGQNICITGGNVGKLCANDSDCDSGQCLMSGYRSIQEGRTIYVNATNAQNILSKSFYTNIYLMSYNQNAKQETISIFNQMLENWEFNTNIKDPDIKAKAQRDTVRLEDLNIINNLVENYKLKNGFYPKLDSGSYVKGFTFSVWPSWGQSFALLLNGALPTDPLNRFKKCGTGFNEKTCWDSNLLKFDEATILKTDKSLDTGSYVYQYNTQDNGQTYKLYYNTEFLGLQTLPSGGTAYQCFDESLGKWVNNGSYHSSRFAVGCVLGSWRSTCGNGKVDIGAGEQCDGNNVNYCEESNIGTCNIGGGKVCKKDIDCGFGGICFVSLNKKKWNNEIVQVCNSSCKLSPETEALDKQNYDCGGYCGDGILNGIEKCDINNIGLNNITCQKQGWGEQGQVGCNLNSCGYYGGGCINGPLTNGDVRVRLEWAKESQQNTGGKDLDIHLLVPYNNTNINTSELGKTGDISKEAYAWLTKDDKTASGGPDIDGDSQPDGLEIVTFRQVPGTGKYHKGIYKFIVRSYNPACFTQNCKDIRVVVTQMDNGKLNQRSYTLPGAKAGIAGSVLASGNPYWHVFNMDENGLFTDVNTLSNSLPSFN